MKVQWFLTTSGRTFSMYSMAAIATGLSAVHYLPQALFLDKYRSFVQNYSGGQEVKLNKELEAKYQKCLEILKVPNNLSRMIVPFSVFGFDLFHAGSSYSRFGALVGIPTNFNYKTTSDIDEESILINQKKIDWSSDDGKKLADALILPEKVQMFGICREILATQNYKLMLDAAYPMASIAIIFTLGQIINHRAKLYTAPRAVRGVVYILLGTFGAGLYCFLKDYTEVTHEVNIDMELCELGEDFIESGVIFYDKLIKRNQALRELMGKEGEKKYTKLGNERFLMRQPRIALIHRKMFFESKLEELRKTSEEINETQ